MDLKRFIKILPFILGLLIIPVTMRMVEVQIPFEVQMHWRGVGVDNDIVSYAKSVMLIISGVVVAGILFFTISNESIIKIKSAKPFIIAFAVLLFMAIISAIFGGNGVIAYGGAPSRYEGLYAYIGYFILFFYALTVEYDKKTEHSIIIVIAVFTVLCSIVGFTQYIGKDIFLTPFATSLYIPEALKEYRSAMTVTQFSFKNMYLFTTHYNYSSMLMSVVSMFWCLYFVCVKEKKYKIISGLMSLLSVLMLLGANARSGIMAVFIAGVILCITFISKILSNKKMSIVALAVIVIFVGIAAKLGMMSRFTSLVEDIKKISASGKQEEVYIREQIPLKDIKTDDTSYTIIYNDVTLKFDNRQNSFYDENGNILAFETPEQGSVVFKDGRYANFSIGVAKRQSNIDETEHLYHSVKIDGNLFNFDVTDKVQLVNHLGIPMYPEKAERIGFKGMERLGSGRGFITASTIPLILKSPLIGYGPDAFLQIFNQDDIYTKMYVYGNPNELVDKPHNLYLLYAINFGVIGLGAFLFIIILLIVKMKRKYKENMLSENAIYIGAFAGVLAYMGSGFFNDSVVAVSPIFWILLGIAVSGVDFKIKNKFGVNKK